VVPSSHPAARRGVIGLDELAGLDVIHGPRRASPATYDRWLEVLQAVDPRFDSPTRRCDTPCRWLWPAPYDLSISAA
jgi:hypothetical protein